MNDPDDKVMYNIYRYYADQNIPTETVKRGVTLTEAQKHCNDPESSYSTCTTPEGLRRTEEFGAWFDGYDL